MKKGDTVWIKGVLQNTPDDQHGSVYVDIEGQIILVDTDEIRGDD